MNASNELTRVPRPRWAVVVAIEACCIALSLTTVSCLLQVPSVLRRTPFGLAELITLVIATGGGCVAWCFFRLLADVALWTDLRALHPGRVAGWLSGGVWVAAGLASEASLDASTRSYAVFGSLQLGTLAAAPLVVVLLGMSLRRQERRQGDWRSWAGFVAGCTLPAPLVLGWLLLL